MGKITLREAAQWCGGRVEEKYADRTFFGASNDSRKIQPGELFVVLQGERDGHDYIPAAMERGAAAVLGSRQVGDYRLSPWDGTTLLPSTSSVTGYGP